MSLQLLPSNIVLNTQLLNWIGNTTPLNAKEKTALGDSLPYSRRVIKGAIKVFVSVYTCMAINHLRHAQASVTAISSKIVNKLREQPRYCPKEILQDMRCDNGIHISYKQAWRDVITSNRDDIDEEFDSIETAD